MLIKTKPVHELVSKITEVFKFMLIGADEITNRIMTCSKLVYLFCKR